MVSAARQSKAANARKSTDVRSPSREGPAFSAVSIGLALVVLLVAIAVGVYATRSSGEKGSPDQSGPAFREKFAVVKSMMTEDKQCSARAFEALKALEKESPPKHDQLATMYFLLGLCYSDRRQLKEEMRCYERLIAVGNNEDLLPRAHSRLAKLMFVEAASSVPDWPRVRAQARNAARYEKQPDPEVLLWLGAADIALDPKDGNASRGLETVKRALRMPGIQPFHFNLIAEVMAGSSLPWSTANEFFRKARKKFPESVLLAERHGTVTLTYGEDYASQDRDVVIPALRFVQEDFVTRFRHDAAAKSGFLNCSAEPGLVYDWADERVRDVAKLAWIDDLPGDKGPYGTPLPLRWSPAALNFTWGNLTFEERESYLVVLRNVHLWYTASGGVIFDTQCRVYFNMQDERPPIHDSLLGLLAALPDAVSWPEQRSAIKLWGTGSSYHLLCEELGRVLLLREKWSADPAMLFVIVGAGNTTMRLQQILEEVFGLPASRFVRMRSGGMRLRELHYADWRRLDARGSPVRDGGELYHYLPPRRVLLQVRAHFDPNFATPLARTGLIWISRIESRRLVNEAALVEKGSTIWRAGRGAGANVTVLGANWPSITEVRRLFQDAFAVFGVNGAGLSNALFCRPGAHLVELACPQRFCHFFGHMAMSLDLRYWHIAGPRLLHGMVFVPVPETELLQVLASIAGSNQSG